MPAGAAILATPAPAPAYAAFLADGETVILALKPSFWFVVLKRAGAIGGMAAIWGLMAIIESLGWFDFSLTPIALVFIAIGAALLLWSAVDRVSRLYLLTDKRTLRISGVFARTSVEIPLHMVTTVVLHRTFAERVTGTGSILFTSAAAGGNGGGGGDLVWFIVDRPVQVVSTVRETLSRYGGGPGPTGNSGAFGAAT